MKKYSIPLTLLLCSHLSADEPNLNTRYLSEKTSDECGESPSPVRLGIRHIEGNGIGYNKGYTTIEGFFTPAYPHRWLGIRDEEWTPFLDLRYHEFNNGKPALNAGVGFRRFTPHVCWGLNAYYDYRKTSHQNYNQVGLGFEALGRIWDFRVNGYVPVGTTRSSGYSPQFVDFEGNSIIVSQKHEFAFQAVNAEAGLHLNEFGKSRARNTYNTKPHLYVAAGPYYLNSHEESTWGGQFRIALDIYDCIRVEANTSYDNIFHGIGQGQLTLMFQLGKKKKITQKKGESCNRSMMFSERALQRVDRFEIIAVDHMSETLE